MVKFKSISASEARNNLSEVMEKTFFDGEVFVLERREMPMSVVVGIKDYQEVLPAFDRKTQKVLETLRTRVFARADERSRREGPLGLTAAELVAVGRREREGKHGKRSQSRR